MHNECMQVSELRVRRRGRGSSQRTCSDEEDSHAGKSSRRGVRANEWANNDRTLATLTASVCTASRCGW